MKKIVVDFSYNHYYHAGSKAREDVNRIAMNNGFTPFLINTHTVKEQAETHPSPIYQFFYRIRKLFILLLSIAKIKKRTLVLIQYPIAPFTEIHTLFFFRCLKRKKCHLAVLVHDTVSFRNDELFAKSETKILNTATELIVHTTQMMELFKRNGIVRPCKLLWLFDYLTNEVPNKDYRQSSNHSIAFAGNLDKSLFLKKLTAIHFGNVRLNLYGNKPSDTSDYPNWMKYVGRFSPENITMLTEDWGLAWDGDSIETIHGPLGNYLRYISPHKVSLYIAAGIPVVVSKDSALAQYVEENHLGITISSLTELDQIITAQNEEELLLIRKSVAEMSQVLRNGGRLGAILKEIVREMDNIYLQSVV
ncbi:MAG: hypothetical protein J6T86_05450 [Bacteroidales bacterium]|nr:hypothetical protein [Bacteroidales bacterium]